tara:strand:+ start:1186 stop:1458 length:273 start_codon:yes stop_codon:yes gene_type:complete
MILIFAIYGIEQKIERAIREIKEPNFDKVAANRKDWFELARLFAGIMILLVLGTTIQGAYRCISEGNDFSGQCVWAGMVQQINVDLSNQD